MSDQRTTNRLLMVVIAILLTPIALSTCAVGGCAMLTVGGCLAPAVQSARQQAREAVKTQSADPGPASYGSPATGKPATDRP